MTTTDQSDNARDDILSQDFEGGVVPPTDWTLDNGTGANGWEINSAYVNSGTYSAYTNDYSGDQTTLLLSPAMDLSSETNAAVTFYQYGKYPTW